MNLLPKKWPTDFAQIFRIWSLVCVLWYNEIKKGVTRFILDEITKKQGGAVILLTFAIFPNVSFMTSVSENEVIRCRFFFFWHVVSSPPNNVSTNKQLFKKIERPQKLGEVKAKFMTKKRVIRYCSKIFPVKTGWQILGKECFHTHNVW